MSNILPKRDTATSSIHVVITTLLGMVVTGLCCYAFYVFRTSTTREQALTDAMKVIRAATEIVSSIAERGLPNIRGRLDELESRGRVLEQHQRSVERILTTGSAVAPNAVSATSEAPSETVLLAARRAARAVHTPESQKNE